MNQDLLLAAAAFILASSITPGPNNTMLMASGVNFGMRRTLRHLAGVQIGFGIMLLAVGLGLHAVLAQFPGFYDALRLAGAAYMLVIAWKLATAQSASADVQRPAQPMGFWGAVAFQWVNPKAWVMAVTFMSTYPPAQAGLAQIAPLVLLFIVLGAPCSAVWAGFGSAMRSFLQDPKRLRIFNVTMALALVASLYPMLKP
jgi:threonine/homoserine/homoserine lactone efflux protein